MSPDVLRAVACDLSRLKFDVNNPHRFFDERRRLADLIKNVADEPNCTSCTVNRVEFQLDEKRRQFAYERRRREEAEARADQAERALEAAQRALDEAVRMLRQMARPRRRGRGPIEGQLALFDDAA